MKTILTYLLGIWRALVILARAICYLDDVDPLQLHPAEPKPKAKRKKR